MRLDSKRAGTSLEKKTKTLGNLFVTIITKRDALPISIASFIVKKLIALITNTMLVIDANIEAL